MNFCTKCGTALEDALWCGNCGAKVHDPAVTEDAISHDEVSQLTDKDRTAGILCFVGAGLIAVGSFLPYVVIVTSIGISQSRSAYQMGHGMTLTYAGPLILLGSAFFVYDALRLMGVLSPMRKVPRFAPIITSVVAALYILNAWDTSGWTGLDGATVSHGVGGVVSLGGALFGIVAFAVRRSGRMTKFKTES